MRPAVPPLRVRRPQASRSELVTTATAAAGTGDAADDGLRPYVAPPTSWPWHTAAVAVALAGIVAQLLRPLAPDLGAPPAPQTVFDDAFLARAAAYSGPLYLAAVIAVVTRVGVATAMVAVPATRRILQRIIDRIGTQRPARAAAAAVAAVVVITDVVLLPLTFWAGYVHEGAYGLRTQGLGGWAYDWAVAHIPVWMAIAVLALLGFWLLRVRPAGWAPLAGLAAGAAGVVVIFASPLVLEPLSYRFTSLPAGPVRDEVEHVIAAAGERVNDIVVADASRRTVRQNAYISGLGSSRRVVLYDTLVDGRPPEEVGIVLGHELAHQRHGDIWRYGLFGFTGSVTAAYVLAVVLRRQVRTGRLRSLHDPAAAGIVVVTLLLLNVVSQPVQSAVSRRAEAAADLVALDLTGEPAVFSAMQQGLARANLSQPLPPRWISWWRGSHPAPMARIAMARWWDSR